MGRTKRRSQVVSGPTDVAAIYAAMPTAHLTQLLALLAPTADRTAGTREFYALIQGTVAARTDTATA